MAALPNVARPHRPGRLRNRLLVLVVAPVLGVATFAGWEIHWRVQHAGAALRVERAINHAAELSAARRGMAQELVPSLARAVVRLSATTGTPLSMHALGLSNAQIARLRAATDRSVAAVERSGDPHAVGPTIATEIKELRRDIDSAVANNGFDLGIHVIQTLTRAQDGEIAVAVGAGVAGSTSRAAQDLLRVSQLVQYADLELARLAGFVFLPSDASTTPNQLNPQQAWLRVWGAYLSAYRNVLDEASRPVAHAIASATDTPAARGFDTSAAVAAADPQSVTTTELVQMFRLSEIRSQRLGQVLNLAKTRAVSAAAAQRHSAMVALWAIVAMVLALLAGCTLIGWRVLRSITAPLRDLAESARRVSQGVLDDVPVHGPEEVRTAAEGLASAVANLRNIEAQASAISAGELDNEVLRNPQPGPLGRVLHGSVEAIIEAIHDRDAARVDLDYRTAHDSLTGLVNRAQALATAERSLHRAQRAGAMTAVMFVDLDHFKAVNDAFGHEVGDAVLLTCARRMMSVVRGGDMVARIGGDEFLILLEDVAGSADAVALAERVVAVLAEPIAAGNRDVHVGASVGLAVSADGCVDIERLLGEAEVAADRAKQSGRGRVGIFDNALRTELAERAELDEAIWQGLQRNEFELHYQPIVFLPSGRVYGFEALIRWHRPGHGLVMPDSFIPSAEQSRRINDIGRWTLFEALNQLARWHAETGNTALTVGVNISGRHLASPEFLHDVRAALTGAGIPAGLLVVEITETVVVSGPIATMNLNGLRDMGVRVALDDFGTGFTSIRQLRFLPVDCIKIDRSFVISTDPAEQRLLTLMASAATAFGLVVVVEGVEESAHLVLPLECNVTGAQGFHYSRPVSAAKATELVRAEILPSAAVVGRG
jgi:diguanylate cyclase (GGDEF)-like protein